MTSSLSHRQRGNIFSILLGGIVLSGALSIALYQLMGGSVLGTVKLARQTTAQAQVESTARAVIADSIHQTIPDCDGDSYVEPRPWRTAGGGVPHPINGGLLPLTIGTEVTDAWGTDYGYCVWDTGSYNNPTINQGTPGCGAAVNRRKGNVSPLSGVNAAQTVISVISAGPDKTFQTTCADFDVDHPDTDLITTTAGSDDIVRRYSYSEATHETSSLWSIKPGAPSIATISKDLQVGDNSTQGGVTAATLNTIAKISAGGAAIIADQTVVGDGLCDSAHAGLVRFKATTPGLEFCNGTTFTPITSGSGWTNGGGATSLSGLSDAKANYNAHIIGLGQGALVNVDTAVTGTVMTVVQTKTNSASNVAAGTGLTATFDSTSTSGNFIIVTFAGQNVANNSALSITSVTDNGNGGAGNTYTASAAQPGIQCNSTSAGNATALTAIYSTGASAFVAPAGGTKLSVTVKLSAAANISMSIMEVSGMSVAAANQPKTGVQGATGNTITATANGALAQAYNLVVASSVFCNASGSLSFSYNTATPASTHSTVGSNTDPTIDWIELFKDNTSTTGAAGHVGSDFVYTFTNSTTAPSYTWNLGTNTTRRSPYAIAAFKGVGNAGAVPTQPVYYGTAAGYEAINTSTAGGKNTAIGYQAAKRLTLGLENTAAGALALDHYTTGAGNAGGHVALGESALTALTTGLYNTAIGANSLGSITTGSYALGIGAQALQTLAAATTAAQSPVAIGYQAAKTFNAVGSPVAIGYQALTANTGLNNTGFGYRALATNTAGTKAVAIGHAASPTGADSTVMGANAATAGANADVAFGYNALLAATAGNQTAFGYQALGAGLSSGATAFGASTLSSNTNSSNNTAFGAHALQSVTTGSRNTAAGSDALSTNTTGSDNTGIGARALAFGATPSAATAVGTEALRSDSAAGNTAAGYQALYSNSSGTGLVATGYQALYNNTGSRNTAYGAQALYGNTSGTDNTAAGYQALYSNTTGSQNTALGVKSLYSNTTGQHNSALGMQALYGNTTGNDNTAAGYQSLYSNTSGSNNTAAGYQSLYSSTTGNQNTAAGHQSLYSNTTGSQNTAAGYQSLYSNTTGDNNAGMGYRSLYLNSTGSQNTAAGARALEAIVGDSGNTAIGYKALSHATSGGTNTTANTAIGHNALAWNKTGTNNTAAGVHALLNNNGGSTGTAVAVVSTAPIHQGTNESTSTVTFNPPPTLGNTVIVTAVVWNSASKDNDIPDTGGVTDNRGNTYKKIASSVYSYGGSSFTGARAYIFAAYNVTTNGTPLILTLHPSRSDNTTQWGAIEVSGIDTSDPLDQIGEWHRGDTTPTSSGTSSTVQTIGPSIQANILGVSVMGLNLNAAGGGSCNITTDAAWTQRYNNDGCNANKVGMAAATKIYAAVSSVSTTWGHKNADRGVVSVIATFRGVQGAASGTGTDNTAVGYMALGNNTTGSHNTAVGAQALSNNTTGSDNTALGYLAGPATGALSNTTALGFNAIPSASNTIQLGNGSVTKIAVPVALSVTSDARLKKDIHESDLGLDFILKLKPVSFRYLNDGKQRDYGFIAQDVEDALLSHVTNMVTRSDDSLKTYHLRTADLLAPVVKAIQEQQELAKLQEQELARLKKRLNVLMQEVNQR